LVTFVTSDVSICEAVSSGVVVTFVERAKSSLYFEILLISDEVREIEKIREPGFAEFFNSAMALLGSSLDQFASY
jgi:hypothetical protein